VAGPVAAIGLAMAVNPLTSFPPCGKTSPSISDSSERKLVRRLFASLFIFPLLAYVMVASPAQAAELPVPPEEPTAAASDYVVAETFSTNGKLLNTVTYPASTQGLVLGGSSDQVSANSKLDGRRVVAQAGGTGGTSSASGCMKLTVHNAQNSITGAFLLFTYHTWTRWCWTRSTQNIYDVTTGWDWVEDDPTVGWEGEVNREIIFYDYSTNDGHPRSAHKHWRKAKVSQCSFLCTYFYPANLIRAYYNGTWVWETN
jgi:hypothetical protein